MYGVDPSSASEIRLRRRNIYSWTRVTRVRRRWASSWGVKHIRIPALRYRRVPWPQWPHVLSATRAPSPSSARGHFNGPSFLSASAFRYRVRFLVSIFSSMLRCLAPRALVSAALFLHLRLTEVHAYFCGSTQRSRSRSSTNGCTYPRFVCTTEVPT